MDEDRIGGRDNLEGERAVGQSDPASNGQIEALARQFADDFDIFEDSSDEGISLEEISQNYAQQMTHSVGYPESPPGPAGDQDLDSSRNIRSIESLPPDSESKDTVPVSPAAIIEAIMLVGRPDNGPITATQIAGLMRGVSQDEVDQWIVQINNDYVANHRAMRITSDGGGYRMQLADDLQFVRDRLLGPARPARLSQSAIDCIALVSYQPGISKEQLESQLGKSASTILNQLLRRQLLEMRRVTVQRKQVAQYFPTQRLLDLVGLETLDDLPTAEEWSEPA